MQPIPTSTAAFRKPNPPGPEPRHHTPSATALTLPLRWALAAILLAAATLKWHELAAIPTNKWSTLGFPPLLLAHIAGETLLALWLLSGAFSRGAWIATTIAFTGFLAVSISKALRGDLTCGCFGLLTTPPWPVAALDATVIVALSLTFRHFWQQKPCNLQARWVTAAAAIAVTATFAGVWLARPKFAPLSISGNLPEKKTVVLFDPAHWVGKPLPLLPHIDIGQRISAGRWVVAIHNPQCRRCPDVVPQCARLATDWRDRRDAPGIAILDVLPDGAPGRMTGSGHPSVLLGHLNTEQKWFVATPAIMALHDGHVLAATDEEPLNAWTARVFDLK